LKTKSVTAAANAGTVYYTSQLMPFSSYSKNVNKKKSENDNTERMPTNLVCDMKSS